MGYLCLILAIVLLGLSVYYTNKFDSSEMQNNEKNCIFLFMASDVCYGLAIMYGILNLFFLLLFAVILVVAAIRLFNKHENEKRIEA